jgi:amino acid adenylation domain-containing protein
MTISDIEDIYELSPLQQGMLFHTLYDPASRLYFEQESYPIRGFIDIPALVRAWRRVVAHHPVLRSSFHWEGLEKPVQVVHRHALLPVDVQDWRGIPQSEHEGRLEAYLNSDRVRGFELSKAPLMRLALLQRTEELVHFMLSFHHVVLDGWSHRLIMDEVWNCYEADCEGNEPVVAAVRPYGDFIAWLQRQDLANAEIFWREALKGVNAPTRLGIDRTIPGETIADANQGEQNLLLSKQISAALQRLGRQNRLTLNTLVQGAWAIVLSEYSGDTDVVFGTVVSGRSAPLAGVESMVGLFINTLPLRTQVSPDALALPWLKDLQARQLKARDYEYSPLVEIQRCSEVPAGTPLFESLVVFENYPVSDPMREGSDQPEAGFSLFERTNYPLNLMVMPGARLDLKILYSKLRFDDTAIAQLLGHVRTVLEGLVRDPNRQLKDLPLLSRREARQLLVEWNATKVGQAQDACIHELVEHQVACAPDAVALICGTQKLSYADLNRRANQLARYLQTCGVGPESFVGLCLERSTEQMVALLAILKAGAAYVPLDPSYPHERLALMLADGVLAPVVLSRDALLKNLPTSGHHFVRLDGDHHAIDAQSHENPSACVRPENIANVLYTSGSTGIPKGVMMTHRALVNLIYWQLGAGLPDTATPARTLQFAPVTFDVSFQEIFSTWASGGTLVLVPEETRRDPAELLRFIAAAGIERLFVPTVALHQLAEVATRTRSVPSSLRAVITAGEQLRITPAVEELFAHLPGCRLHNHYGPTESHVVAAHPLTGPPGGWPRWVPIGRPISNTQIYLLDRHLHPVPIGVAGELYIGGDCLARGYRNRPGLTADRFIPNPFSASAGARLYRTGDLARYLADAGIEFIGRVDSQIKVRGFRIEPGEIEVTLAQHPAVHEAVVVARGDTPGDRHLVVYFVPCTKEAVAVADLRSFLAGRLPEYMLPQILVQLDRWPLTGSGKLNRQALPAPGGARSDVETFIAPQTALERILAMMYADVLKLKQVGVHDNFFTDLGGHSLQATQLVSRVRDNLQVELPLRSVFDNPSVLKLAQVLLAGDSSQRSTIEKTAELLLALSECSDEEIKARLMRSQDISGEAGQYD